MPDNFGERLAAAWSAGPPPVNGRELVSYVGGKRALQEVLSGMDGPPPRRNYSSVEEYKAASNQWRSAGRRAQRYAAPEGRQRRELARLDTEQRAAVEELADVRKFDEIERHGLRARLKCQVTIDSPNARGGSDKRLRTIPSGGPGVLIPGPVARRILDADEGTQQALFLGAFIEAYGLPPGADLDDVWWVKIWPEGDAEPDG